MTGDGERAQRERQRQADSQRQALWTIARALRPGLVNRPVLTALLLLTFDVLLISRYQPVTALALVAHTPPLTLLAGVVINVGPLLMSAAVATLLFAAVAYGLAAGQHEQSLNAMLGAVVLSGALAVFIKPSLYPSPTWLLVAVLIWVVALGWTTLSFALPGGTLSLLVMVVGVVVISSQVIANGNLREALARPYLPAERLSVAGGRPSFVGYVLGADESGRWTTIMREGDRGIEIVASETLLSRRLCVLPGQEPFVTRWPLVAPAADAAGDAC